MSKDMFICCVWRWGRARNQSDLLPSTTIQAHPDGKQRALNYDDFESSSAACNVEGEGGEVSAGLERKDARKGRQTRRSLTPQSDQGSSLHAPLPSHHSSSEGRAPCYESRGRERNSREQATPSGRDAASRGPSSQAPPKKELKLPLTQRHHCHRMPLERIPQAAARALGVHDHALVEDASRSLPWLTAAGRDYRLNDGDDRGLAALLRLAEDLPQPAKLSPLHPRPCP
jgi:hypothetical protein